MVFEINFLVCILLELSTASPFMCQTVFPCRIQACRAHCLYLKKETNLKYSGHGPSIQPWIPALPYSSQLICFIPLLCSVLKCFINHQRKCCCCKDNGNELQFKFIKNINFKNKRIMDKHCNNI